MINLKELKKISNLLSLLRLLLAIPFWILLGQLQDPQIRILLAALGIVAFITDILDGYFARKYNQITELGKIIDPFADKFLIGVIIVKLFLIGEITTFYFSIILVRDITIFLTGIFLSKKIGKVLPSNLLGKVTVFFISLVMLLIFLRFDQSHLIFQAIYNGSILLVFGSLLGYGIRAIEFLRKKNNEFI